MRSPPGGGGQDAATLLTGVLGLRWAGFVHGGMAECNVLLGADGPVIIDLPQAVDAAGNNHASRMLLRDVANLRGFFGQFAPDLLKTDYGPEIWDLYQRGMLHPDTQLTGKFERPKEAVAVGGVIPVIDDARADEAPRKPRLPPRRRTPRPP